MNSKKGSRPPIKRNGTYRPVREGGIGYTTDETPNNIFEFERFEPSNYDFPVESNSLFCERER